MEFHSNNNQLDKSNRLFLKVQKGDHSALEQLFRRTFPRFLDFALKITKDEIIAEDIVQDVFVKLWEKRETIQGLNIEGYLFRLVRNKCLDHIKYIKVISGKEIDLDNFCKFEELYRVDFISDEPYLLIQEELKSEIQQTIDSLPPRCKEVFVLSRQDGLKNREIAEKLQINIKNVERHLSRATKTFKEKFPEGVPLPLIILVLRNFF